MELRRDPVFRAGLALAALALAQLALAWMVEPAWGHGLAATMAAELVTGREAAIPLATDQAVPPAWIAAASIVENLAVAAIVVPAAIAAARAAEAGEGKVAGFLRRLHTEAEANTHRAASAWGIFVLMLVPFLPNGPVLAGLVGRLVGADGRRLVAAIVAAVVLTATAWAFLHAWLAAALAGVDPRLARVPAVLAVAATALALAGLARKWRRGGKAPG